jgi:hypothetical protein
MRCPLGPGSYPELELRVPRIGWHGIADLLILSPQSCEIMDFKTGAKHDAHRFQLQVYALLWSRDSELNPEGRLIDKLTISYDNTEVTVDPPTVLELDALEQKLVERRLGAETALSATPPEARPSVDNCRHCSVRHLCDEYWQSATLQAFTAVAPTETSFKDLQITIVARHGPTSWDGIINQSKDTDSGKQVLLRTNNGSELHFSKGDQIRVLDAHLSNDSDDDNLPIVATMSATSEVFILRPNII